MDDPKRVLQSWLSEVLKAQAKDATVKVGGKEATIDFDGECICLWELGGEDDRESKQLARFRLVSENPAED
jgi:hypothetical protein